MNPKLLLVFTFLTAMFTQVFSQNIELDFPKLSGDTVWIYTFSGSRVDSISIALDNKGKASLTLSPQNDYRGLAYLYIPNKGEGDFILAEKNLRITCPETQFNAGMLQFPQSEENTFLRYIFQRHGYLLEMQEWLQDGGEFKGEGFDELFDKMVAWNVKEILELEESVRNSPLYAARFMELVMFMQRLYGAVMGLDAAEQEVLRNEMENSLNINALYHSGNLWTDIHTYYPGLFYGANSDSVQTAYAHSILAAMQGLEEPVLTAFLGTALTVCERTNQQKAQEVMLQNFIMRYPTLPVSDSKIRRMQRALILNKGAQAPPIAGLSHPIAEPTILIFFEGNCDHCIYEIDWIIKHYQKLEEKGYRIISISADTQYNNYQFFAATFPWDEADRLCDFKGFQGENFKNYGITGTPVIFVINEDNIIMDKHARMSELFEF
ncbi:MAG: redoxin domain-containing protein [Bacteroidetes bacterium]|nr:redoxin domain-containing protein [Bacteroidota bacterium]MCL2303482.1 redoxin domain-containing protein [Lentimicrobiaceae bacterium]